MTGEGEEGEARLRRDARAVIDAGIAAADPRSAVARALERDPPGLRERLRIVAVGKAARSMLSGARAAVGPGAPAIVVEPAGPEGAGRPSPGDTVGDRTRVLAGGHPLPDDGSLQAARAVASWAREMGPDDRLLLLLSGGSSALLCLPAPGLELEHLREVTDALLRAGAPIHDLNTVRKHLEVLKGGGLARLLAGTPVHLLAVSDVVGDRWDVLGSGPVSADPTTFADALEVVERYGIPVPDPVRRHLEAGAAGERPETPGEGDPALAGVDGRIVVSVADAVGGALREARDRGYEARGGPLDVSGEAREVGESLGREAAAGRWGTPRARILGGETTVTVNGPGRGGPAQEVALGAATALAGHPGALVFAVGTDGVDGPTDAAGGWATATTVARARAAGLDVEAGLARNDAYRVLDALDDLVRTGPTGTNVMDLYGVLVRGP